MLPLLSTMQGWLYKLDLMAKLMFTFSNAHHELTWFGPHRNVSHHNLTTAFHLLLFLCGCAYKPYQFSNIWMSLGQSHCLHWNSPPLAKAQGTCIYCILLVISIMHNSLSFHCFCLNLINVMCCVLCAHLLIFLCFWHAWCVLHCFKGYGSQWTTSERVRISLWVSICSHLISLYAQN